MSSGGDVQGNLLAPLLARHERDPGAPFALFLRESGPVSLSSGELFERAARFARLLEGRGIGRETVFVLAPLGPDLVAAFVGALLHGAIPALLAYPSSKVEPEVYARNLCGVLELTRARAVVSTRALEGPLGRALGSNTDPRLLWLEDAPAVGPEESAAIAARARAIDPASVAFLQHSSGSTGLQKGVALSHRSVLAQIGHYAKALELDPTRDKIASWLPLYHDMGLIATFVLPLVTGTPVVFMDPFRWVVDPVLLLQAIHEHRATLAWLPNFAYVHMAKRISPARSSGLDLSCVRGFVNCSEPVRESSHRQFLERFAPNGVRADQLWVSYAMAENTFAVTQAGGSSPPARVDRVDPVALASERRAVPSSEPRAVPVVSCGRPIEGCEVVVVDEERRPLPERAIGELSLRSDSMLTEYHNNAEATARALGGGFYFTGDLGYLADGEVFVTGRKKDLIIVGGRNYYPTDIEDLVSEEEGVVPGRVAALGHENVDAGTEEVIVVAETEVADAAARTALRRAIQKRVLERLDCALGHVELVGRGWVVKTSSGKVARTANLAKFLEEREAARASARAATTGTATTGPASTPSPAASLPEPPPVAPAPAEAPLAILVRLLAAAAIVALALALRPNQALVLYRGF